MTDTTENASQLLGKAEQDICRKLAAEGSAVVGQRAAALLSINDGATQAEASTQTGLTVAQIRYLLTTYRKKGLAIFPDDVLAQAPSPGETVAKMEKPGKKETLPDETPPDEVKQVPAEAKEEKKTKKAKKSKKDKGKKSKKDKGKDKKDKKKKKGKKSKKGKSKKAGKKKSKK